MYFFCRYSYLQRVSRLVFGVTTKNNLVTLACAHRATSTSIINSKCFTQNLHTVSHSELCDNKLVHVKNTYLNQMRHKTKKSKTKQASSETNREEESESEAEEEEDEAEEEESELDYDSPLVHKDMVIYTLRADSVVAKGLKLSKHEAEQLFYSSKFLLNGKKLLKKGIKLHPGDIIDIVMERTHNKLLVKRVKVLKVGGMSSKGKEIVHIRMWRDPFEIDHPEDYAYTEEGH